MSPDLSPWRKLEQIGPGGTVEAGWRSCLGESFAAFRAGFLRPDSVTARYVPCPFECGCDHEVFPAGPGSFTGVCRCDPWTCDDLALVPADVVIWKLSWPLVGRALAKALSLESQRADLSIAHVTPVGTWPGGNVPVWLATQTSTVEARAGLIELCARVRRPFLLVCRTGNSIEPSIEERLTLLGARWVSLEAEFALSPQGALRSRRPPAEFFANLAPVDAERVEEDVARKALAIVQQLDQDAGYRPPSLLKVFHLYCVAQLSAQQIAMRCGCSKATVVSRLNLLRRRTGIAPERLRRISSHLEPVDDTARDSRARHIHRENLVQEEETDDG